MGHYTLAKTIYIKSQKEDAYRFPKINSVFKDLSSRKISKTTCEKYGYGIGTFSGFFEGENYDNVICHTMAYGSKGGKLNSQKLKLPEKVFMWGGELHNGELFGQNIFQPREDNFIIVTEGELDAMAIHEATGYPAVSIPAGALMATESIKNNLKWLMQWGKVLIWFDNDEWGKEPLSDISLLFDADKIFFISAPPPFKDASDLLTNGHKQEIKNLVWSAQPIISPQLENIIDWFEDDDVQEETISTYPWESLNLTLKGIMRNSLYLVVAGTGVGKTTMMVDIVRHLAEQKKRSIVFMLEDSKKDIKFKFLNNFSQTNNSIICDKEYLLEQAHKYDDLFTQFTAYAENKYGALTLETLVKIIKLEVRGRGAEVIILDNLSYFTEGLDFNAVGVVVKTLRDLTRTLNISIIVPSHLNKGDQGKGFEEGKAVSLKAIYGSSRIAAYCTEILAIERNTQSDKSQNSSLVRSLKSRSTGFTGVVGILKYSDFRYSDSLNLKTDVVYTQTKDEDNIQEIDTLFGDN